MSDKPQAAGELRLLHSTVCDTGLETQVDVYHLDRVSNVHPTFSSRDDESNQTCCIYICTAVCLRGEKKKKEARTHLKYGYHLHIFTTHENTNTDYRRETALFP